MLGWGAAAGYVVARVEDSVRHWRGEWAKTEAFRREQQRLWRQYATTQAQETKERHRG